MTNKAQKDVIKPSENPLRCHFVWHHFHRHVHLVTVGSSMWYDYGDHLG